MPDQDLPPLGPTEPPGDEVLLNLILEAAARVETPASGLRAAAAILCSRPSRSIGPPDAEDEARAERIRTVLREGDAEQPDLPEPEYCGPGETWISLESPLGEPGAARRRPPEDEKRGLARIMPRRRGLLLLVVLSGVAAYVVNTKGCSFFKAW